MYLLLLTISPAATCLRSSDRTDVLLPFLEQSSGISLIPTVDGISSPLCISPAFRSLFSFCEICAPVYSLHVIRICNLLPVYILSTSVVALHVTCIRNLLPICKHLTKHIPHLAFTLPPSAPTHVHALSKIFGMHVLIIAFENPFPPYLTVLPRNTPPPRKHHTNPTNPTET